MKSQNKASIANYVFFGTDNFAARVLDNLLELNVRPKLIITNQDQPAGRKLKLTPPPAKLWALEKNIPFYQTGKLNKQEVAKITEQTKQSDFFLVASFGQIIPKDILDLPQYGTLNIHPSLLPKYRGPSPIQTALLEGEKETGVTIMKLDEKMDHGPIFSQEKIKITPDDNYLTLEDKTSKLGAELFSEIISKIKSSELTPTPQDHSQATYTKKFSKADGEITLKDSEQEKYNKFRAFYSQSGVYFFSEKDNELIRIKITEAEMKEENFIIKKIIPAGKKEMAWDDFKRNI